MSYPGLTTFPGATQFPDIVVTPPVIGDAAAVAAIKAGDSFLFDYGYLDVVYSVTLGSGDWGLYTADGSVVVGDTLTPQIGTDELTSLPGTFTTSISLAHLDAHTSARVHYDGQGFILDYTLDGGTTWTTLGEDGVIDLPTDSDFDLRVTFPGNIESDPAVVNSISVYVLGTETMISTSGVRRLDVTDSPVSSNGLFSNATLTVSAADETAIVDPADDTTFTGPQDYTIGTIEIIVNPATSAVFASLPSATIYRNAVLTAPKAGVMQHIVAVLDTPGNIAFELASGSTIAHLALYPQKMTANDVTSLYLAQTGGTVLTIHDAGTITVTESKPTTDFYAFAWQIQSGGG